MKTRKFTLLADGPSDAALMPILTWMWTQHRPDELPVGKFADLDFDNLQSRTLQDRITPALELYPCDVLFIHRDAEKESMAARIAEIKKALTNLRVAKPAVCVVPVRMSEAWMLFDHAAIRRAADNPSGRAALKVPPLAKTESLPNPKAALYSALRTATELPTQRLSRFKAAAAARLVTEHMSDFTPLRRLKSFVRMESEFKSLVI